MRSVNVAELENRLSKYLTAVKELLKMPTGKVAENNAIEAVLANREEEL
jgi:hypothetical protein